MIRPRSRFNALSSFSIPHSSFCVFQIVFPQIDIQMIMRWSGRSPEINGSKAHGVNWLRLLATAVGISVWINERAMYTIDDPLLSSYVARETRMPGRVEITGNHTVARFEPRCSSTCWPARRGAMLDNCRYRFRRKRSSSAATRIFGSSCGQFFLSQNAFLDRQGFQGSHPVLVVT